jgi:hypothetical protein
MSGGFECDGMEAGSSATLRFAQDGRIFGNAEESMPWG